MRGSILHWTLFGVLTLTAARGTIAQSPDSLNDLVTSDSISAGQKQRIAQWVDGAVSALQSRQPDAVRRFRSEFVTLAGPSASSAFRDALGELIADRAKDLVQRADPERARALTLALVSTRSDRAVDALLGALSNADPATRLLAAQGLARLKGNFGGSSEPIIDRIRQAALAETAPLVRAELCRALTVPARLPEVVPALAEIIRSQTDEFRRNGMGDVVPLHAAVEALDGLRLNDVPSPNKIEAVKSVANLMAYAVEVYVDDPNLDASLRENLERIVDRCEPVLVKLLAQDAPAELPKLADAMRAGGADRGDKMRAQLGGWLGSARAAGVLNAAPFSLPAGGGFAPISPPETP